MPETLIGNQPAGRHRRATQPGQPEPRTAGTAASSRPRLHRPTLAPPATPRPASYPSLGQLPRAPRCHRAGTIGDAFSCTSLFALGMSLAPQQRRGLTSDMTMGRQWATILAMAILKLIVFPGGPLHSNLALTLTLTIILAQPSPSPSAPAPTISLAHIASPPLCALHPLPPPSPHHPPVRPRPPDSRRTGAGGRVPPERSRRLRTRRRLLDLRLATPRALALRLGRRRQPPPVGRQPDARNHPDRRVPAAAQRQPPTRDFRPGASDAPVTHYARSLQSPKI